MVIDMSGYLAAERACIEAERAYFAALGWPPRIVTTPVEESGLERRVTTPVEESGLERRFREAREREVPTREEGAR